MPEDNKTPENEEVTILEESKTIQDEIQNEPEQVPSNENLQKDVEEFVKKNKKIPLKKVLFIVIGFLLFLIIIGIVLFFLGYFSPEEPKELKTEQKITNNQTQETPKEENYKFDIKDINSKKLNEQLSFLTNKNITQEKNDEMEKLENEKKLLEEQKKKEEDTLKEQELTLEKEKASLEKKRLELENEKNQLEKLKQEAIDMKEQLLANQNLPEANKKIEEIENKNNNGNTLNTNEEPMKEKVSINKEENKNEDTFLKFINVAKIKGALYKKYLDKITNINPNIILCRDDKNRIEIYYGPFKDESMREELLNELIKNNFTEAYKVELTKDEFDARCNY